MKIHERPTALSIAGSDSGGGAGIQTDLKVFEALGVHGTCAVTAITAQNPAQVSKIISIPASMVLEQIRMVRKAFTVGAVKTGMLFSTRTVEMVADVCGGSRTRPILIVDPVAVSTSGKPLLANSALRAMKRHLLPQAALVTPNLHEVELLLGHRAATPEKMREAARQLYEKFGCAALVKGGHLRNSRQALDFFYDGKEEWLLIAPYVTGIKTHGSGCAYSAAIAGYAALGFSLSRAVNLAKDFVTRSIAQAHQASGHPLLNLSPKP